MGGDNGESFNNVVVGDDPTSRNTITFSGPPKRASSGAELQPLNWCLSKRARDRAPLHRLKSAWKTLIVTIASVSTMSAGQAQTPYDNLLKEMRRDSGSTGTYAAPYTDADMAVYQKFLDNIKWPAHPGLGTYKSLYIGQRMDLRDRQMFDIQVDAGASDVGFDRFYSPQGRRRTPSLFECIGKVLVYCKLQMWNDTNYAPDITALSSAFGYKISLNVVIAPDKPIVASGTSYFGQGRIVKLEMQTDDLSGVFSRTAAQFFSDGAHEAPMTRTFGEKDRDRIEENYNKNCRSGILAIKQKPESQITINDQEFLQSCQSLALSSTLALAAKPVTTYMSWSLDDQNLKIVVIHRASQSSVMVQAEIEDQVQAVTQYFRSQLVTPRDNSSKSDF